MTTGTGDGGWQEGLATLARAQTRTEEQFATLAAAQRRTDARLDSLAAAQTRTNEQLATLTQRVDALAVAQLRTEERLTKLVARVDALTEQMTVLVSRVDRMNDKIGELSGITWELRYRDFARAYLGRVIQRIRVLSDDRIASILDTAVADGRLSHDEADEVGLADVICRGRRREDGADAYLVVEVSAGVGTSDVERASRRAELLARTGMPALAAVAGQWITPEAGREATVLGVWQVRDGQVTRPTDGAEPL